MNKHLFIKVPAVFFRWRPAIAVCSPHARILDPLAFHEEKACEDKAEILSAERWHAPEAADVFSEGTVEDIHV